MESSSAVSIGRRGSERPARPFLPISASGALRAASGVLPLAILAAGVAAIFLIDNQTNLLLHKYLLWLFDYHHGFARRALVGEITKLFAGAHLSLAAVEAVATAIFALTATVFALCVAQIRRLGPALVLAALLALSPMALKNLYYDYGRFDSLLLLYTAGFILVSNRFRIAAALLLAAPLLVLVHEIALFIALPVMAASFWLSFRTDRPKAAGLVLRVAAGLALCAVFAVTTLAAPADPSVLDPYLEWRAGAPIETLGDARFWAAAGLREALPIVWSEVAAYDLSPFALTFIPTLAFIHRLSVHLFGNRLCGWLPFLGAVHAAPLFLLAFDWARWASLVIMVMLAYLAMLSLAAQRGKIPEARPLKEFNFAGLDGLLVAWSFVLPAFGVTQPFSGVGG